MDLEDLSIHFNEPIPPKKQKLHPTNDSEVQSNDEQAMISEKRFTGS